MSVFTIHDFAFFIVSGGTSTAYVEPTVLFREPENLGQPVKK